MSLCGVRKKDPPRCDHNSENLWLSLLKREHLESQRRAINKLLWIETKNVSKKRSALLEQLSIVDSACYSKNNVSTRALRGSGKPWRITSIQLCISARKLWNLRPFNTVWAQNIPVCQNLEWHGTFARSRQLHVFDHCVSIACQCEVIRNMWNDLRTPQHNSIRCERYVDGRKYLGIWETHTHTQTYVHTKCTKLDLRIFVNRMGLRYYRGPKKRKSGKGLCATYSFRIIGSQFLHARDMQFSRCHCHSLIHKKQSREIYRKICIHTDTYINESAWVYIAKCCETFETWPWGLEALLYWWEMASHKAPKSTCELSQTPSG